LAPSTIIVFPLFYLMLHKAKVRRGVSTLPAAAAFEIMLLAATVPQQQPSAVAVVLHAPGIPDFPGVVVVVDVDVDVDVDDAHAPSAPHDG